MDLTINVLVDKILTTEVLKSLFICTLFIVLNVFFLFGFINSFIIIICYLLGIYVFYFLLAYIGNFGEILTFLTTVILNKYWPNKNIDDRINHKNERMLVSLELDQAVEKLMNEVLNHYVTHWYSNISSDGNFIYEIRVVIKRVVSVCCRRLSQVKVEDFIYEKFLPTILNHMRTYNRLKYDQDVLNLHVAVHSRTTELVYLQNVSRSLLRFILSETELKCKSSSVLLREILSRSLLLGLSDTICNPFILNRLLLHYLKGDYSFLSTQNESEEKVDLLSNFVSTSKVIPSQLSLRPDLNAIVRDVELKDAFLKYLKTLGVDHILQFYLDIEIFNAKILNPNLEAEEIDNVYRDAWDIYSVYFSSHSPYCIEFETDLASKLRKILSKDVLKLKSTPVLFEASENAYQQLDTYCSEFYTSIEFCVWLYGRCESCDLTKSNEILNTVETASESCSKIKSGFELSNKINLIKEALNPNNVLEGQVNDWEGYDVSMELGEDVQVSMENNRRNMNNWTISIPTIGSRLEPITNKAYTIFVVTVQDEGNEWIIERRPNDFNTLDMKLTEFHGTFPDSPLPPRRALTNRTECIQLFEEYMRKLIKNPVLKNSELLYTFLTSKDDFEEEETTLGKLLRKSVVPTLRKERGQNLEVFINSFVSSCRQTKYEWKDVTEKKPSKKSGLGINAIYCNNFDIGLEVSEQTFFSHIPPSINDAIFVRPSTSILYLGVRMYNLPAYITKLLLSLQACFGGIVDEILYCIARRFFQSVFTSTNIVFLVDLIGRTLFDNKQRHSYDETKLELIESLDNLKHSWSRRLYTTVYELIQDAKLNKQLFYQLLDLILEELFSELKVVNQC